MPKLKISDNRRFLTYDDGSPFFYLADTAWELFHRLDRDEADHYLSDRATKGFTVIQAVVLAELDGLTEPNPYGDLPLHDLDPTRPNEAYFAHVDFIVERAAELGLFIGMLPTWGDKWNKKWGVGPEIFTPENARAYGRWLGRRYAASNIIWILGGDRPVETARHRETVRAMALGLKEGDGGTHLASFHPSGGHSSAEYWHAEEWLDFNMLQSGHTRNQDTYRAVADDYARRPVKPCMDAEPAYEDHPSAFDLNNGYLDDYDVRKGLYWALFSGAFGHTYGCHDIWQMWQERHTPVTFARRPWFKALSLPGSSQVGHARALLESRPFLTRVPDPDLIVSDAGEGTHHVVATRDTAGTYALVYLPSCKPVTLDLDRLSADTLAVTWYDPRTGESHPGGEVPSGGYRTFTPPTIWPDWVLILDDPAQGFPQPATPNGRHAGAPISHSGEPDPGFGRFGGGTPTAKAAAVAAVQPGRGNSAPLQLDIDVQLVEEEGGLDTVAAIIMTHNAQGGTLVNLNIISRDQILEAHEDPTKYPDLVVRVTGYSAYFHTLSPEYRQQVIDRILAH